MRRESLNEALYGGFVERYSLDLLAKTFTMQVDVLDNGKLSSYEVKFVGLSRFEFEDELVNTWERVEVTEVYIDESPERSRTEEWAVTLNLWDVAHISLRCAAVQVDGETLR